MPSALNSNTDEVSILALANVVFINDPQSPFNFLELSESLFSDLFPVLVDGNKYVLVKVLGSDLFTSFKIYKVNLVAGPGKVIRFINNSIFNNYELTINSALVQSIQLADIPLIEKLYVSVPESIYDIMSAKTQRALKSNFNTFLEPNGNIINSGDYIPPINGQVKLAEPVPQGKVSDETSIILIKEKDFKTQQVLPDFDLDVDLSTYLSKNLNFYELVKSNPFSVKPLQKQLLVEKLPETWSKEDSEFFVFINSNDFIKLGFLVFNGDLVELNWSRNSDESKDLKIIVKVFTLTEPNHFVPGSIYLSPILLINLGLSIEDSVFFTPYNTVDQKLFSDVLPIAESVTISRVASQITMDKTFQKNVFSSLKTSLSNSFRIVQSGDFFAVVIDSVLAKTMFDTQDEENEESEGNDANEIIPIGEPDAVAWFKIVEVKGSNGLGTNQFIIDPNQTLLVSSGVEFIRLPKNENYDWYNYLNLPPIFNFNLKYQTTGEFAYANEFKKILSTNISSKIGLRTTILLQSLSRGIGKTTLVRNMAHELGLNLIELDCFDLINPGQELKTIGILMGKIDKLIQTSNSSSDALNVLYLKHIENLCPSTDSNDQNSNVQTSLSLKVAQTLQEYLTKFNNLVIVMSCNDIDKLNENISSLVKFNITFSVPTEKERLEIFKFLINNETNQQNNALSNLPNDDETKVEFTSNNISEVTQSPFTIRNDINYQSLALQSAGLTPRDLISIIKMSKKFAINRLHKLSTTLEINLNKLVRISNGGEITWTPDDFNEAINEARNQFSDSIGAPRIPNVKWEDIGGLDLVKDEILDTIDMPLKHPELFKSGIKKRSGILFYGPPGTGKTLLAKAIATNFSLNFFSVKGPELLNMYIGESEANVRRVFQRARDAKPCVIFFDELDSVAPKRGNQGDSGGVMDRIVSQLLAELDGMGADGDGVFVVGATNRPDLLDEALLRPGRFDKMLYLGISDTNDKQTKILEALTRKFKIDENVDLAKIAERCSFTYTGADFYALCSDSMLNAMTRVAGEVDTKINDYNKKLIQEDKPEISTRWWFDNVAKPEDIEVLVTMQDFIKSQQDLSPSVSAEELEHYLRVRENFEGGKEKAQENQPNLTNGNASNGVLEEGATIDLNGHS